MAACGGNIPEQGRPPEVDGDGRKYGRERKSVELVEAASPKLAETCKETLKKVFFPKRMIPGVEARNAPKNAMNVSINNNINNNNNNGEIVTVSGRVEVEGRKGRNSFHQDVEEALNSLLWQPYEYQNKQKLSDGSLGSSSSCSSLSSSGLESSNNGTERNGNAAPDLHLLVNNLHVNRLSQSLASRDAAEQHSGTQLESVLSTIECGTAAASRRAPLHTQLGRRGPCSSSSPSSCPSASSPSDDTSGAAAMRVEIPPQQQQLNHHALQQNQQIGNGNINLMHYGGTSTMIHLQQRTNNNNNVHQLQMQQQQQIQVRGAQNNLSSVNVVGLPSHPRQASVPSSAMTSNRNNLLMPTHSRNISEPFRTSSNNNSNSNVFLQGHHPRNGSEPVATPYRPPTTINNANIVSILNHQRYTTNVNTAAVNHMRSSSMPYQNVNGGGGAAVVHQRNGSDLNATRSGRVPLNVSNVNVNYYRAVPVNVVSAVPTIHCYNNHTTSDSNNVSNVNIVQAMPVNQQTLPVPTSYAPPPPTLATNTTSTCTEVIVHSSQEPVVPEVRTFTSTEAQTDDTVVNEAAAREQRRRERRERRHHRRVYNHRHNNNVSSSGSGTADNSTQFNGTQTDRLPDLLNNTLPPPYSTMPSNGSQMMAPPPLPPPNILVPHGTIVQTMVPNSIVPNGLVPNAMVPFHHPQVVPGQVPLVQGAGPVPVPVPSPTGFRFPFPAGGFRRSRYSEEPPKSCCGLLAWRPGSLRWFIALIALVAVCCVLVGTALGAMRPAGRDHLTVSLLMIGVGIILVTVSGVAWRLTSHDSSTCRSMLGLGSTESVEVCTRRFVPRLPPSYGRPHHPYAAMMYPEFQYRPPPPSYQASMQEYRLRLLLLDRGNTPQIQAGIQNAVSPPPTYRSHSGSLLRAPLSSRRDASQSEYSCPPSYRSQTSSSRPATMLQNNSIIHSREQSLSLSESNHGGSAVNVVNILTTNDEDIALDNITLDSLKLEPDNEINPLKMLLKGSSVDLDGNKDGNLVTIVQTNDQSPVIVTVSGSSHSDTCNSVQITEMPTEMEILAHL